MYAIFFNSEKLIKSLSFVIITNKNVNNYFEFPKFKSSILKCSQTRSMAINSTYFAMMVPVGKMVSFR